MDATVGGAQADSYLSLAAARDLAEQDLGLAAARWLEAVVTDAQRQRALMRATREVDAYLATSGVRWSTTQALLYPRAVDTLPTLTIVSSSVADPTVVTTRLPHGLATGDSVSIAGHTGSTPALDGVYTVTVLGETTFTVPLAVTVAGTGGTVAGPAPFAYVPAAVRHATFAQAKFLLAGGADAADRAEERAARRASSVSEADYSYAQAAQDAPYLTAEARAHLQGVFGRRTSISSVRVGTDYSDPYGTEVLA